MNPTALPSADAPTKHCLIVDDSAVIRKVARRILDTLAVRVSEAEDGEGALAPCRAEMPDAVLLDAAMPTMDGYDVLRALRALPGGDAPKIVMCTVENDVAQVARAMHAGANAYVLKPFDRGMITGKLQEIGLV